MIAEKFETKRKTLTDTLNKKQVILQSAKKVEAVSGYMERINKLRGLLHDEIGAIFVFPL